LKSNTSNLSYRGRDLEAEFTQADIQFISAFSESPEQNQKAYDTRHQIDSLIKKNSTSTNMDEMLQSKLSRSQYHLNGQ
jgi:hypothetical protein